MLREHTRSDGRARLVGRRVGRGRLGRPGAERQGRGRATTTMRARPAPTACRSPRASPVSDAARRCRTSTTSASTGSTCRPLLEAEPGSDHGYDVVDHDRVDPARGGAEGLAAAVRRGDAGSGWACSSTSCPTTSASPPRARTRGGGTSSGTVGSSAHADAFDVDWDAGGGRVRIPVRRRRRPMPRSRSTDVGGRRALPRPRLPAGARHDRRSTEQHYELVHWRSPTTGSTTGASSRSTPWPAIRVEDRAVFDDSHVEIRRWFDEGLVDGLRVDHPDGLRDPAAYLDDLRDLTGGAYVLVEKILEPGEVLLERRGPPPGPPGTTSSASSTASSPTPPGRRR